VYAKHILCKVAQSAVDLDMRALIRLRTLPHTPASDHFAIALSAVGDHSVGWYAVGCVGAWRDREHAGEWLCATATVAATEQTCRAIKGRVKRPRPALPELPPLARVTAAGSFPSSHAAAAAAAVEAYAGLLPRPVLLCWAVLTSISRPYLGVHYPSDVVAGSLVGAAVGQLARRLERL
jgi:membrane-associated phospholipid phosphatase